MSGTSGVGFAPEEVDQTAPTRAARLKWVLVVDAELPAGRAANAAACVAAATAAGVGGLLGDDALDADGHVHPGLPWAGCAVLAADPATLRAVRARAAARPDVFVADMPVAAQTSRVYADYLADVGRTAAEDVGYCAVSLVGPRGPVDRIVGGLPLLR